MYFELQHITRFRYSDPISESIMEVRMQPRTERWQRCLRFSLTTSPEARVASYNDYLGNAIHFFDIPKGHKHLQLIAQSLVELTAPPVLPDALSSDAWTAVDQMATSPDYWDWAQPTPRTRPTDALRNLEGELNAARRADPLTLLREINTAIYGAFDYVPNSTQVDSPIDDALSGRSGVCQDFAHIMIAVVRDLGLPARYVSGYLVNQKSPYERSTPDASHAWIEALLPEVGWVGFDPTNNVLASDRHIRVAIGRDYTDVPPTHGVYKGIANTELEVEVRITPAEEPKPAEAFVPTESWKRFEAEWQTLQQQHQQQQ